MILVGASMVTDSRQIVCTGKVATQVNTPAHKGKPRHAGRAHPASTPGHDVQERHPGLDGGGRGDQRKTVRFLNGSGQEEGEAR